MRRFLLVSLFLFIVTDGHTVLAQTINSAKKCKRFKGRFKISYRKKPLMDIVKDFAEKTCYNFIISSNVRSRKITIISEQKVTLNQAYKAFLTALEASDIAIIKTAGYRKLVYTRNASRKPVKTILNGKFRQPRRDDVVTYMLRAKYIDVYKLSRILRRLHASSGSLITFKPSGIILLTDYATNIYRLLKIVKELDVQEAESKDKMFILQVENSQAQDIVSKIRSIFRVMSRARSRSYRNRGQPVDESLRLSKILADQRTNRIIFMCSNQAYIKAASLIKKLDLPLADGGKVRVHYLKYAKAGEIAQTLSNLSRGSRRKRRGRRTPSSTDLFRGEVRITADKATNSLIIVSNQRDYENLLRVINRLDVRRKQVFVEMVILEISVDKTRNLGVVFHGGAATGDASKPDLALFGTQLGGANSILLSPSALTGMALALRGPEIPNSAGLLGQGTPGVPAFGVLLRALQTNNDVDIISTPHILTAANEEALLRVGQNVPFIAGTSFSNVGLGLALPVRNIQRQDVALTLRIKPQINAGDQIKMDLDLEITEVAAQDPELGPTTTKRKIKTTIRIKGNRTVVLGGLMRDKVSDGISKVPILGDIPLIGALFRTKNRTSEKRNLLIFMTPHIILQPSDFRRIFRQKMKERREFLKRFYSRNTKKWKNKSKLGSSRGLIGTMINRTKKASKISKQAKSISNKR